MIDRTPVDARAPHVRLERHTVCGELVRSPVASEERDPAPPERADANRRRGRPVRGRRIDVDRVVEEVVEPGTADDPDLRAVVGSGGVEGDQHQAAVSPAPAVDELLEVPESPDVPELPEEPLLFESDELLDDEPDPLDVESDESEDPDVVVPEDEPRLSVLKKPLPLKVTPTGWNTFFTGRISPDSGCVYSVSVSSAKDCCTSMVSPVSTNLYTYVGITERKAIVRAVQVRSAVIPAAGLGTRFLPATKAVPKELFPIGDRPAIQIVIDEALGAGSTTSSSSRRTGSLRSRSTSPGPALLASLEDAGREETAERIRAIGRDWRLSVIHQDVPKGLVTRSAVPARRWARSRSQCCSPTS